MEIYTIQRPSLLLAAACAPSAPMSMTAPVAVERARVSQVHQVQIQAELGRTNGSTYGTTGFVGSNGISVKTDGASGVPPRGRPV